MKKSLHLFILIGLNMMIDRAGYRLNVGIVLVNELGQVFWGKRHGHDAWQFPQGGLMTSETPLEAMFRELNEEVGLVKEDVKVLGVTKRWLKYRLPQQYIRHGSYPLVIGQKQKWFLLKLVVPSQKIRLDLSDSPEFDSWKWIDYREPSEQVIFFKRQVYSEAMKELAHYLKKRHGAYVHSKRKKHQHGR